MKRYDIELNVCDLRNCANVIDALAPKNEKVVAKCRDIFKAEIICDYLNSLEHKKLERFK